MPVTTIAGAEVTVDDEGFMTEYDQWNEDIANALAANIGIELGEGHWQVIKFLREDYKAQGETPMLRRVSNVGGVPTKELFQLFPKKPAKKMSYIAGVPEAARLRLIVDDPRNSTGVDMTFVPDFGDEDSDRKICFMCLQGHTRHGVPIVW